MELKLEIKAVKLFVALSGILGCGKTTMLRHIQEALCQDKEILASSLSSGFAAAVFVFFARTAAARIIPSDFLLRLAICGSFCTASCYHPSA
jgi:predicted AAA+ superfamily ATPase